MALVVETQADAQLVGVLGVLHSGGADDEGVVLVRASAEGLRLSAVRPGAAQTHVSLPRPLFRSFAHTADLEVALPMRPVLHVLALAPGDSLRLSLSPTGASISLGSSVSAEVCALDPAAAGGASLAIGPSEALSLRLLASAALVRTALAELLLGGAGAPHGAFALRAVPGAPALCLAATDRATGTSVEAALALAPGESSGVERCVCAAAVDARYPAGPWLAGALAVLGRGTRASLRVSDASGVLALQAMVPAGLASAYVEFVVCPLVSDDSDSD